MQHQDDHDPGPSDFEARHHWLICLGLLVAAAATFAIFSAIDGRWQALYPALTLGLAAGTEAFRWRPNGYARRRLNAMRQGSPVPLPPNASQPPTNQLGWTAGYGVTLVIIVATSPTNRTASVIAGTVLLSGGLLGLAIAGVLPDSQARWNYAEAMRRRSYPPPVKPQLFNEPFMAKYYRPVYIAVLIVPLLALAFVAWVLPDTWSAIAYTIAVCLPPAIGLGIAGLYNWSATGPVREQYEHRLWRTSLPPPPSLPATS